MTAPFVIDAPMDRPIFETYVETQLAPTRQPGDIVISDNLAAHQSAAAEQAIRAEAPVKPLFLPPYNPEPQPNRDGFRKSSRPCYAPGRSDHRRPLARIGEICDLFSPQECQNYFAPAGYGFI